jgi:hypothetical protein
MFKLRSVALASAFALTVAAAFTALAPSGQTRETNTDQACAHQTWPEISAQCLTGNRAQTVREVPIDDVADRDMQTRFAVAFD